MGTAEFLPVIDLMDSMDSMDSMDLTVFHQDGFKPRYPPHCSGYSTQGELEHADGGMTTPAATWQHIPWGVQCTSWDERFGARRG